MVLEFAQQARGGVLAFLHVGLIERIDGKRHARDHRGHFPAEEFRAEIGGSGHADFGQRRAALFERRDRARDGGIVVPVERERHRDGALLEQLQWRIRTGHDRHDAAAFLAGAFGDELLDPVGQRLELARREQKELVAALHRAARRAAPPVAAQDWFPAAACGPLAAIISEAVSRMALTSMPHSAAGTRPKKESAE